MSTISNTLKIKIKAALDNAEAYNASTGANPTQAKDKVAEDLAKAVSEWLLTLKLVIPTGLIQVQGSPSAQANGSPLTIPLSTIQ